MSILEIITGDIVDLGLIVAGFVLKGIFVFSAAKLVELQFRKFA